MSKRPDRVDSAAQSEQAAYELVVVAATTGVGQH